MLSKFGATEEDQNFPGIGRGQPWEGIAVASTLGGDNEVLQVKSLARPSNLSKNPGGGKKEGK